MATVAYTSGVTVKLMDTAASPNALTTLEECFDIGGVGQTNELIEVTHFASAGVKEYIGGLADGDEITLECNKVNTAGSMQGKVKTNVEAKATISCEVTITDGTVAEVYTFDLTLLSWKVTPAVADKNTLSFTGKISGTITQS